MSTESHIASRSASTRPVEIMALVIGAGMIGCMDLGEESQWRKSNGRRKADEGLIGMAEKSEKKAKKGGPGRPIRPGQILNPGGRPKMSPEERQAWQALATKCRTKIEELVDSGDVPPVTLAKFAELALDRAYGKAIQAVELGGPDGGAVGFRFVDPPARSTE